jgi:MoaA/NifB/PqqE/SkfB family radical SAM enzyme
MDLLNIKSVRWDITNQCNLSCKHCYVHEDNTVNISIDKIKMIIQKLLSMGLREVNFSGREPTLRRDLCDLIIFSKEKGLSVNLTTNGVVLSKNEFYNILCLKLNKIVFSLDGSTASIHDKIRGSGNFNKTYNNILNSVDYIKQNNLSTEVGVSCTLHKLNAMDMVNMIELCKKMQIQFLAINPISFCGSASNFKSLFYLTPIEVFEIWEKICIKYNKIESKYELYLGVFPMEAKLLNLKHRMKIPVIQTGCSAGKTIYINSQGDALPCYMLPSLAEEIEQLKQYLSYWNILNETIDAGYNHFESFLTFANSFTQKDTPNCQGCLDIDVCKRCPLISISDSDAVYRCQLARKKMDELKINITPFSVPQIDNDVKWQIDNDILNISIKRGNYNSEKKYELTPIVKKLWCSIDGKSSIKSLEKNIANEFSELKSDTIHVYMCELIDYFYKEGIVII